MIGPVESELRVCGQPGRVVVAVLRAVAADPDGLDARRAGQSGRSALRRLQRQPTLSRVRILVSPAHTRGFH